MPPLRRSALAVVCAAALALGGCGVKGAPEPPPGADPETVVIPGARPAPPPQGTEPSRPFILDGLLM